ncbi:filamentous haemagglutinin family protein [Novosphingobium sp.]|uniref:filamentous haemagglutinin family protein n=1 Tax=Novosphingobium sp. TaxID=1874826 RepID=UPI003340BA5E
MARTRSRRSTSTSGAAAFRFSGAGLPAGQKLRPLAGVSLAALLLGLSATPAAAQLAQLRANAGTLNPATAATPTTTVPARPATMVEALARQQAMQTQAQQLRGYVQSARNAAYASVKGAENVTDGISTHGLNPIAPVRALTVFAAAGAAASSVTANAPPLQVAAARDATGLNTWEGANAPVQTTTGTGASTATTVTITQTQQNALLSWLNFDVGAQTTLQFVQKQGGVAKPGWTVVNRVVNSVDPSKILGTIKADGTVLILNRNGVIFGPHAQVNLNGLIVSSLELGNFASQVVSAGQTQLFVASTVAQRNTAFLQNGLLVNGVSGYQGQILSALLPAGNYNVNADLPTSDLGAVVVDSGASITSGAGGYIILAGPSVINAGSLYAADGQVSLQGGMNIGAVASSGGSGSADINVRGLVLTSQVPNLPTVPQAPTPDQGAVVNYGYIESRRGYISLGTAVYGTVENSGLLQATTSVSRNGFIQLTAGAVNLGGGTSGATASGIVILPDDDGETVPQGTADSPPAFKSSRIAIGDVAASYLSATSGLTLSLFPSMVTMGSNAFIYAPNANVVIGADASKGNFTLQPEVASGVTIASGAVIDVAGVMDVAVAGSTNSVKISPAKKNELRDTPNYRSVTTDGSFTLNGATLYVDATASGVRSDGVAWQGSPLLEAGSAISQVPVTAAGLMTKGGTISIDVGAQNVSGNLNFGLVPSISIARDARFDISGGWITYGDGFVLSSELITAGGTAVNIANADPNGSYVGVVNGFTATQPGSGTSQTYYNAAIRGEKYVAAYDEGRDAGALQIVGTAIAFDGTVYGNAFAGAHQLAAGLAPTASASLKGDPRKLQYSKYQLPSGGLFRIGSFSGSSSIGAGQDIVVYDGTRIVDSAGRLIAANPGEILLDAQMLSRAGLSGLMLQTSGAVILAAAADAPLLLSTVAGPDHPAALALSATADLALAAGGTLEIDAGRTIRLDGKVRIADGTILAQTYQLSLAGEPGIGSVGNAFRSDDDIASSYGDAAALPTPFNIVVNGTLDVSGAWTNDYARAAIPRGAGWINGGSISLTVAPRAFVSLGGGVAGDLSGSILVNPGSLLDVSAGGYVSTKGALTLSARGGNVSLLDQTIYAGISPLQPATIDNAGATFLGQTVAFTPTPVTPTSYGIDVSLVPVTQNSVVKFAPGTIRGFGFSGGGIFKLIAPDIAFTADAANGNADANATVVPFDFLTQTGFGTLSLTAYHSRTYANLFDNGSHGLSAFLDTTKVEVGAGQTLNLTQALLPDSIDAVTGAALLALPSDRNVASLLTATVPLLPWYQKPVTLSLNGLMELDVDAGGTITGAAQATIITPKLFNAGLIDLPGGTIAQAANLPQALAGQAIGLTDPTLGGTGFAAVFGATNAENQYELNATNVAGLKDGLGNLLTNNGIFTKIGVERFLYFLGRVSEKDGIVLLSGSVTNLSGNVVYNPVAPVGPDGARYTVGTIINGGSISSAAGINVTNSVLFAAPKYGFNAYSDPTSTSPNPPPQPTQTAPRHFLALPGSTIDIRGTSALLDVKDASGQYVGTLEWSDAGTVALLAGGSLAGATIKADGGTAKATGGTLEWFDPVIRGSDATQIAQSGFSTLIADGGMTLDGTFTLALNKAVLLRSPASIDGATVGANAAVTVSATTGTNATVTAPYINFSSTSGGADTSLGSATGDARVTFSAGASGMDFIGGITFDGSIRQVRLDSAADIRLIGVDDRAGATNTPVLNGALVTAGDLIFDAGRIYTTTGTGNLQRILADAAGASDANPPSPYLLTALGQSTITFLGDHINTATPYSAGSYLQILASSITQNGYLAAPLGRIDFGTSASPVGSVTFGDNSVTSVSGAGMNIPYGTTTNLSTYFFTPGTGSALTQLPSGNLTITGSDITIAKGSTVDGAGGGAVYAFEFVSGTGGSRDVLSRFNTDQFSSNGYNVATGVGYQYADQRQVYAIVPLAQAQKIALYDPLYSADYSRVPTFDDNGTQGPTNLYGVNAAMAVTLDGGGGIAAGQYVLMPAHYALLPGAYRLVQHVGQAAPGIGATQILRDGSVIMGGTYSTAGTSLTGSQRFSFNIESQASFLKYSDLHTTDGTTTVKAAAASQGLSAPSNPLNAAQVVLDPLSRLTVNGTLDLAAATGGRGSQVDILGSTIIVSASSTSKVAGALVLSNKTLANLNANSLLIGGERIDNADGTTTLNVSASRITVEYGAEITAPELLFAVGGKDSRLAINDGANLTATGTLDDTRTGDYVITGTFTYKGASEPPPGPFDVTGVGSLLRVSNGAQRLVDRVGTASANQKRSSTLKIGLAGIFGNALLLNTNNKFSVAARANLSAPNIALSASDLSFGAKGTVSAAIERKLAATRNLTLASNNVITFDPGTTHTFNNLALNAPGITLSSQTGRAETLTLNTGALTILNTSGASLGCGATGAPVCATSGNTLTINASSVTLGSGTFRTYGFDGTVALTATNGAYFEGAGQLALGNATLTLTTPFLIDRAAVIDPNLLSATASDSVTPGGNYTIPVTPDYVFATAGAVRLTAPARAAGVAAPVPAGLRAPGARVTFGSAATPVASLAIDGVAVTASAGVIDARAAGSIAISGGASLSTPGYTRNYGNAQDLVTVAAGGGTVNLVSSHGDVTAASGTTITVDSGIGNAGTLNLIAAAGAVRLDAVLNAGLTGARAASLTLDSQNAAFDLSGFASHYGRLFGGTLAIRTGLGNLDLAAGDTLKAAGVTLTADGGTITIGGTIDTSGAAITGLTPSQAASAAVNGGNIALWGQNGVSLASTARLDTHTGGYADTDLRSAKAGNVTIGIGAASTGAITIASGATLNLGATRTIAALAAGQTGNRLVPRTVADPNTLVNTTVYDFVAADSGGTLLLRAPVVAAPAGSGAAWGLNIGIGGSATITGAAARQIEGVYTYKLDAIAAAGIYTGITTVAGGVQLDATPSGSNVLSDMFVGADGTLSVPWFIRNYSAVSTVGGTSLAGFDQRPGVNLVTAGNLTVAKSWNLAAGTLDTAAALAAGDLKLIPELGLRADGTPYYAVTSGAEGDMLSKYVDFLYRVGGKASGQAGNFSFEAGGNLTVAGSISDGFFTFADKSDATWINYQLGGGTRNYTAAVLASCGLTNNCSNIADYSLAAITAGKPSLNIDLTAYYGIQQGASTVVAPYDAEANSATAAGNNIDPASGTVSGDALGFASLFPLLPDGHAIASSSLRLVAGASGTTDPQTGVRTVSANPLNVDPARFANLTVEGTTQYALNANAATISIGDTLDLLLAVTGRTASNYPAFALSDLIDTTSTISSANKLTANSLTTLNWGQSRINLPAILGADAQSFFGNGHTGTLIAYPLGFSGVQAPLSEIIAFLKQYSGDFLSQLGTKGPGAPTGSIAAPTLIKYTNPVAYTNTLVRSGNGTIDVAASGNIDLTNKAFNLATNGSAIVYRDVNGLSKDTKGRAFVATSKNVAQVGGTAIYTAGARISAAAIEANVVGTQARVLVTPAGAQQGITAQSTSFIPSPKNYDNQALAMAANGGNITVSAGGSVLALTDSWSSANLGSGSTYNKTSVSPFDARAIGDYTQLWRAGSVGQDTEIAIAPKYFTSGIGALGGGNVTVNAGGDTSQLTLALDSSITTSGNAIGPVLMTFGRGDIREHIGGNIIGGQIDLAAGYGSVNVAGSVQAAGNEYLQIRIADSTFALVADGSIALAGVSALAASTGGNAAESYNAAGYFAPFASFTATATGSLTYTDNRANQTVPFQLGAGGAGVFGGSVLPPSVSLSALTSTLTTPGEALELYPSAMGELALFSAGNISSLVIAMSDSDPSLLPGAFSAGVYSLSSITGSGSGNVTTLQGLGFGIPGVTPTTSAALLRIYHNQSITHANDSNPIRIFAGADISNALINVPKQAEIIAGRDISNLYFTGQNVNVTDTTLIQAGRDIVGTDATSALYNLPYLVSSNYVLGGPGNLLVQAGRNLGPFINSAVVSTISYAGGIQTVGNLYDPWLTSTGANLGVLFGVAKGIEYAALASTYLDPANFANQDGALFVQTTDALGNKHPDRTRQIYAPILATWLRTNDPVAFASIFGLGTFTDGTAAITAIGASSYADTATGNAALTPASYAQSQNMYAAFARLDALQQDQFLINSVYFNELRQPADPASPSYLQYFRGYRAIDTLFPTTLGYTDNLAVYTVDPSTVSADHPAGIPTRNLVNGEPAKAAQVQTGNANLQLATLQTASGGNLTVLGPGGTFIAGSVVRTSTQAAGLVTRFGVDPTQSLAYGAISGTAVNPISAIPIGYEGLLTLNGGAINGFTDGNFLVNQSRIFTLAGGDIAMWSSNGDLNAGQGPKTASNFPPVTVATDLDGYSTVDSAGSVSGAGIGAFQRLPTDPTSSIILVAPAGLVDAGDAGVRASGSILVAAAHVANADSFKAGGSISGVPSRGAAPAAAPPSSNAASAAQANATNANNDNTQKRSVITVDVEGFAGNVANCDDPDSTDPQCRKQQAN